MGKLQNTKLLSKLGTVLVCRTWLGRGSQGDEHVNSVCGSLAFISNRPEPATSAIDGSAASNCTLYKGEDSFGNYHKFIELRALHESGHASVIILWEISGAHSGFRISWNWLKLAAVECDGDFHSDFLPFAQQPPEKPTTTHSLW